MQTGNWDFGPSAIKHARTDMRAPAFKISEMRLSIPEIVNRLHRCDTQEHILGLYKAIIGSKAKTHIQNDNITSSFSALFKRFEELTTTRYSDLSKEMARPYLPYIKSGERDTSCSILHSILFSKTEGWSFLINFQVHNYFVMGLKLLVDLKKKNRSVYNIVRSLMALILTSGWVPGLMPDNIVEWLYPDEYLEESDLDESDIQYYQSMIREGLDGYKKEICDAAPSNADLRKKRLKKAIKHSKSLPAGTLSELQIAVLKDMLRLACLVEMKRKPQFFNDRYTLYEDEVCFSNCFAILWDEMGGISDDFFNYMDEEWGNRNPPVCSIIIKAKDDVVCATWYFKILMLMQRVAYWWFIFLEPSTSEETEKNNNNIN